MNPIFLNIEELLDSFDDLFSFTDLDGSNKVPSKLPATIVSSSFPPADIYIDDAGDLHFEFAIAGYSEDHLHLSFEDNYLILKIDALDAKTEGRKYIQRGIKHSDITAKYIVPFTKYNASQCTAKIEDGILSVIIPAREEAKPVTISISK